MPPEQARLLLRTLLACPDPVYGIVGNRPRTCPVSPSSQDRTFPISMDYEDSSQPSSTAAPPPRNQPSSSSIPNFSNIYFPIASASCNTNPAGREPASYETDIDSININAQTRITEHANNLNVPSPASVLQQADSLCEVLRTALRSTNAVAQSNTTPLTNDQNERRISDRALRLNVNTSIEILGSRNQVIMSSSANSQPANPGQTQAPSSSG